MHSKIALKSLNHVPTQEYYRAALFKNGLVFFFPINSSHQPLDKTNPVVKFLEHRISTGPSFQLTPAELEDAERLVQLGIFQKKVEAIEVLFNSFKTTRIEAKKYFFSLRRNYPGLKGVETPEDLPDEAVKYRFATEAVGSFEVSIEGRHIDLDLNWTQTMTRRPNDSGSSTFVMPSGDVAFVGDQPRLQKLLRHLLKADRRVSADFQVLGSEKFRGMTIAGVLGQDSEVDVALGVGRGRGEKPKALIAYHGTSGARLKPILSKGLIPNMQGKVYVDLIPSYSDQNVYLALDPSEAENYATRQAIWDKSNAVVLKVTVRDITKVLPDEDQMRERIPLSRTYLLTQVKHVMRPQTVPVDTVHFREFLNAHGEKVYQQDAEYDAFYADVMSRGMAFMTKESVKGGTFAYRGRIPPQDIKVFMEYKRQSYPETSKRPLTFDDFQEVRQRVQQDMKRESDPPAAKKKKANPMSIQSIRLASRYLLKMSAQQPTAKLDNTTRSRINAMLRRTGLDGNGRYDRAQKGYAEAVGVLADFGIELDGIANSFEFTKPKGRLSIELAFTNEEDSFSPIPISNALLIVQFERLMDDVYEVLAYVS